MAHRPAWCTDGRVFVSFAETVGINKDGNTLYEIDGTTGTRTEIVDDRVAADISTLIANPGKLSTATARWVPATDFSIAVPTYYDDRYTSALEALMAEPDLVGFTRKSVGELIDSGLVSKREGHGSPSQDLRQGSVPYIKVSDVRAGQVNINPSNLVTHVVAEKFWRAPTSGLMAFDLITPIRASKNIGEFAVLMPGQEEVVLTKEFLVLRSTPGSIVDNFYLLWALSLRAVRSQWKRIVLMQTNREDVGERYREIEIPWPPDGATGRLVSAPFREFYEGTERLRSAFVATLASTGRHHVFLGSAALTDTDEAETAPHSEEPE